MSDYPTPLGVPVDRVAARVIQSGVHYAPKIHPSQGEIWDSPPATMAVPEHLQRWLGTKHGRIVVVGLMGRNAAGWKWLVRCDCGLYTARKHKKINKHHSDMGCPNCYIIAQKKREYSRRKNFEATGEWDDRRV